MITEAEGQGNCGPLLTRLETEPTEPKPPAERISWTERTTMRLILAFLFPSLMFFTIGRPLTGILCFFLHLTVIGWIPATIWAVYSLSEYNDEQRYRQLAHRY